MAFAVEDFEDLMRLLSERPDWQERMRRAILADDFLALPQIVRDLAEAQRRAEERLAGVEERLARVEDAIVRLAEAQARTEDKLSALIIKVGTMEGYLLELRFQHRSHSYFSRMLRRVHLVEGPELERRLSASLSDEELDEVFLADLVVRGIPARQPELGEVFVVMEISSVVDRHDVERAAERANLLRKAGIQAIPAAAGESAAPSALLESKNRSVLLLQDGRRTGWEEALQAWVARSADTPGQP